MKIGLISKFPPEECGIGIYTQNLYNGLKANKVKVIKIGSLKADADYNLNLKSSLLKEHLNKIIKKEKLDLLHFQYIPPYYGKRFLNQNLIRALSLDIPKIVTLHEVQYGHLGLKTQVLRKIEKQIIKHADKVIVHSPLQKKYLKDHDHPNVENILMGITPLKINPRKNKTLLCFGIISREKGHPYLLEAMKSLKDHDLILAGNPVDKKYQQELSTIIKENKLNNVIVDFGWISEERKAHYYEMASILVLPYTWGPYTSAVIHDAMSYNMPVVVSKVGAVWEVIDVFKTGSVVKPKNSKALIKGIKDVEKDFSTFTKNINKYRKKADWIEVAKKTKSLYQRVLRK